MEAELVAARVGASKMGFFKSNDGLDRRRNVYFRLANINVKQNNIPARSNDTVNRSRVIVTEGAAES